MLTAFLELERITHELALSALLGDDSPAFLADLPSTKQEIDDKLPSSSS